MSGPDYGASAAWEPTRPRLRPLPLAVAWVISAASVYVAAGVVRGVSIDRPAAAFVVAAAIAVINAVIPPLIAALRLPFTLVAGFVLVLLADGAALVLADKLVPDLLTVNSFGDALLAAIVMAGASITLEALAGTNDDDEYSIRVVKRIARRQGGATKTDAPGVLFLEIDGLALPILRAAMRDGNAPNLARWSPTTTTGWSSGRPTCPPRPGPARRGSCSARTTTCRRSAGSTRPRDGS